ncbi:MAG: COX15/CtaA family protein [Mobilicoccus sp.]|nr:COX15/CtaA family protein [Mobilicoccus sp.]
MPQYSTRMRLVFIAAMVFTGVTVAMGSIVAATDSSAACPAWPACYPGQVRPELVATWTQNPALEMAHRTISTGVLVFLALAGWLGRRDPDPRVRLYPWFALVGAVAAAIFGMIVVLFHLPKPLAMLDAGGALLALLFITHGVRAVTSSESGRTSSSVRPARWALAAFGLLWVMHCLGILIAGRTPEGAASFTRVISWPTWQLIPLDLAPSVQILRMMLAVAAVACIVAALIAARHDAALRLPSAVLVVAVAGEVALGLFIRESGFEALDPGALGALYAGVAVVILWVLAWMSGEWRLPGLSRRQLSAVAQVEAGTPQQVTDQRARLAALLSNPDPALSIGGDAVDDVRRMRDREWPD